jgi:hypothetical protein
LVPWKLSGIIAAASIANAWRREVSKTIAKGQPYNLWRRLLNAYAALNFTFDSDRLPDLYGLAQAMQGLSLGIYCAGLWTTTSLKAYLGTAQKLQ